MKELNKQTQEWDDKFGIIDKHCGFQTEKGECGYAMPDSMRDCSHVRDESSCAAYIPNIMKPIANVVIEGVGEDAEVVTNAAGGKQSKSPMAMHLVDPRFLKDFAKNKEAELEEEDNYKCSFYEAIRHIADFMLTGVEVNLLMAMDSIEYDELQQVVKIAKVLQYGADRYEPNNWRLIPQQEHINHALIHLIAEIADDTQDEHANHALCRLMMAYATKKSDDFDYGTFVDTNNWAA